MTPTLPKPKAFIVAAGKTKKTSVSPSNRERMALIRAISRNTNGKVRFIDPANEKESRQSQGTEASEPFVR